MKTAFCLTLFFAVTIISCNYNNSNVAGGPCTYKHTRNALIVVKRVDINPVYHDLLFLNNAGKDTISYYAVNNNYLDSSNHIKTGDTCWLTESKIISGSCNPHLIHIDANYSQ